MRKMKIFVASLLLFLQVPLILMAQHDLTFYQMERVPQRLSLNPAFIPADNSYLGLPFISETKLNFSEPVRFNQVFTKEADDSLLLNPEVFLNKFSKNNRLHMNFSTAVFSFGTKISKGKYFINFSLKEKVTQDVSLPENLFRMLWYGNGSPEFFGKSTTFSPRMSGSVYDEWALTFAGTAMDHKLTYGITAKYLAGYFNVKTRKADFTFYTDTAFYDIHLSSDMEVMTAGVYQSDQYFDQRVSSILFPGNHGLAIDIGATYKIDDRFSVSASMIDLGFIRWKSRTMSFVSKEPGKEFIYSGMTIDNFMEMFTDFSSFGRKISDSLFKLIKIDSVKDVKYTAGIPVRFNVGGSFQFTPKSSVNLLLNGVSCNHHFYTAISAAYTLNWTKALALNVTYSIYNRQYTNVGLGFTLNAGPIQLYLVSDNVPGFIFQRGTNNGSFQFGLNILMGRSKAKPLQTEEDES